MKRAVLAAAASIVFSLATAFSAPAYAGVAGGDGGGGGGGTLQITDRERIGALLSVDLLYSIDEHHTYVEGEGLRVNPDGPWHITEVERTERDGRTGLILRHADPQPLLYKTPALPGYDDLAMEDARRFDLTKRAGEDYYEAGYTAVDLFEHAYAACERSGGELAFVLTREAGRFKRLVEVGAVAAFKEIRDASDDGAWLLSCDGARPFVVTKDYSVVTGGVEVARVDTGKTLKGIDYIRKEEFDSVAFGAKEPMGRFLERMAREVAGVKREFVKAHGKFKFKGSYTTETGDECDEVRIEKLAGPEAGPKPFTDGEWGKGVYGFKVCENRVEPLDTRASSEAGGLRVSLSSH